MASTLPRLPVFQAIASHDPKSTVAVHSKSGRSFTYGELLSDVADAKDALLAHNKDIEGERIAFLVENSYDYVGAQLCFLTSYRIYLFGINWEVFREGVRTVIGYQLTHN
jgi:malonyl-CoA/methylmalonyl-CoA synthetase